MFHLDYRSVLLAVVAGAAQSSSLASFLYEGRIELSGDAMVGSFQHRFFARKTGAWRLRLADEARQNVEGIQSTFQ